MTVLQRSAFNPHRPNGLIVRRYTRYRIRRAPVHHYRVIALQRILQRATVDGRGRVVSSY